MPQDNPSNISRRGILFILSSPSGGGKSTITRWLLEQTDIKNSISATTRAPRPKEQDGVDYYFLSQEAFKAKIAANEMLEYAEVFGNYYGTPRAQITARCDQGKDTIFDIDWQGAQQLRAAMGKDVVSVFLLPPELAILRERLEIRNQDSTEIIETRMEKNVEEITHWNSYDYVVVNEHLKTTKAQILAILTAERLRRDRQTGLQSFVKHLL